MKFFRLDLLTLLISLFILNSCKNQDTVGLGVNSSNAITGALVDSSKIIIHTVVEDSVVTSGSLAKNPLAFFNDPTFGNTTADLATNLNLPNTSGYSLPSGTITIDSTRLILGYTDGFYGDSIASSYKVNVYQLGEKFNNTATYYNDRVWNVSSNLLGSLTFNSRTHDSLKVYNIIAGAPDTLIKVKPQIRIPISNSFILNSFFNANSTTLGSNAAFQTSIKGLYITLDKTKTTGAGGIFMIQPTDTLAIYYKAVNGTVVDTAMISLPITAMASRIQHTYTSAIKAELANIDPNKSASVFYLQGLAGLRAKINFPTLLLKLRNNLLAKDSDIVINRADLVITANPGSNIPFRPLPRITMYQLDIAHQRINIQDASTTDPRAPGISSFGGYYNAATKQYSFLVTSYLQDLLFKRTVDYGTYIAPADTADATTVSVLPTPQVASRTMAVGVDKSSLYQIKLNIIYTKIAK